jgi:hypothetical protein
MVTADGGAVRREVGMDVDVSDGESAEGEPLGAFGWDLTICQLRAGRRARGSGGQPRCPAARV